ncbi:hypothetical protein Ancab_032558, partial [Ancistrocladus abbreviatus]
IRCYGTHLRIWSNYGFEKIASRWAKLVSLDDPTRLKKRFAMARLLTQNSYPGIISGRLKVKVENEFFLLEFVEEYRSDGVPFQSEADNLGSTQSDSSELYKGPFVMQEVSQNSGMGEPLDMVGSGGNPMRDPKLKNKIVISNSRESEGEAEPSENLHACIGLSVYRILCSKDDCVGPLGAVEGESCACQNSLSHLLWQDK